MKSNITVLQLCEYEADFPGSLMDHFIALSKLMRKNKSRIIVTFTAQKPWIKKIENEGIIFEIINLKDFTSLKRLRKIIKKYNVDIIHTHFGKKSIIFAVLLKLIFYKKIKIIRHWRSTPPEILRKNMMERITFYRRLKNIFGYIFWRTIDKFINYHLVNARVTLKYIKDKKISDSSKIELLENSINLQRFNYMNTKNLRSKYGLENERLVIGSIINFRPEKDIMTLIRIAEIIIREHKEVIFIFAGDGPLRGELEKYVKKQKIDKNVIFTGYISEMESIIATCDIIIISNHAVGISNAHLEAMAMSKPIVTFNPGELDHLINDGINGFLIPKGDIIKFLEKINVLIKDRDLANKIGTNAFKTIKEKYNIENWAYMIFSLYYNLLNQN